MTARFCEKSFKNVYIIFNFPQQTTKFNYADFLNLKSIK